MFFSMGLFNIIKMQEQEIKGFGRGKGEVLVLANKNLVQKADRQ
ncbi:hypothetical protein [Micavibrio aeruginosavorus]|nr:hypothetical protein [Micavibrio aeruginosavorus]